MLSNKLTNTRRMRNTKNNKKSKKRRQNRNDVVKEITANWVIQSYGPQKLIGFQNNWLRTTLKYVQTVAFSVSAGTYAENQFRANSVFDPDLTGTGGQPLGFDTISPIFQKYRVNHFGFEVQMLSLSLSYKGVCVVINGAESPTTYDEICEYPRAQQRGIGFNGCPTAYFQGQVLLSQLNGKSQDSYHIDDLTSSTVSTNPSEAINFHVGILNENVSTITLNVTCTMYYDVIFYDPVIPVRSFKKERPREIVVGPNEIQTLSLKTSRQSY